MTDFTLAALVQIGKGVYSECKYNFYSMGAPTQRLLAIRVAAVAIAVGIISGIFSGFIAGFVTAAVLTYFPDNPPKQDSTDNSKPLLSMSPRSAATVISHAKPGTRVDFTLHGNTPPKAEAKVPANSRQNKR
jgi:hypothetical protein